MHTRRRGRRKKSDVVRFSIDPVENDSTVSFDSEAEKNVKASLNQSAIAFGNMQIVIHAAKEDIQPVFEKQEFSFMNNSNSHEHEIEHLPCSSTCEVDMNLISQGSLPTLECKTSVKENALTQVFSFAQKNNHRKIRNNSSCIEYHNMSALCDRTDVHCWWCSHQFTCKPCFLPHTYNSLMDTYEIYGTFCSWNCAKAYLNNKGGYRVYRNSSMLRLMVHKIEKEFIMISPAPPRELLTIFGGHMDIDEFRNTSSLRYSSNLTGLVRRSTTISNNHK